MDTDEFTESGRVVVTCGLGVTEGLKHRIGLDDLLLKSGTLLGLLRGHGTQVGEVRNDLLGVLSLSGSGFSAVGN